MNAMKALGAAGNVRSQLTRRTAAQAQAFDRQVLEPLGPHQHQLLIAIRRLGTRVEDDLNELKVLPRFVDGNRLRGEILPGSGSVGQSELRRRQAACVLQVLRDAPPQTG